MDTPAVTPNWPLLSSFHQHLTYVLLGCFFFVGCESPTTQSPSDAQKSKTTSTTPLRTPVIPPSTTSTTPVEQRRVKIVSFEAVPHPSRGTPVAPSVGKTKPVPAAKHPKKVAHSIPGTRALQPGEPTFSPVPSRPTPPPIDPKTVFEPIPFSLPLQEAEKRYAKFFAEAQALSIGTMENMFLQQLLLERRREGQSRSYQDQMVRLAGQRYVRLRGLKQYQQMGYRELHRLETLLSQYLAQKGSPLTIPTSPPALAKLAQQIVDCTGYYPLLLRQIGLTADSTTLNTKQRYWLRTMFLARWGLQAWGIYPLPVMMGQDVYQDYLKARILWTPHFRKRLFAVREARSLDPKFPVFRVLGWLFVQAGRVDAAKKSLQDAIRHDPKDAFSRTLLDKISSPPP